MDDIRIGSPAGDLADDQYGRLPPPQGVLGTLYVMVLVAGTCLAVALTILFVQAAREEALILPKASAAVVPSVDAMPSPASGSEEQLKTYYLECARATSRRRMELDDAMACAEVADVLLARSFNGDFDRMIEWWQSRRDAGDR